ncbi:MAG TPA: site-specific DNA-methyltransferase [Vineibacter sp.]|nr:site-specific DNA-methyltransferase [Vineibacter sp.]
MTKAAPFILVASRLDDDLSRHAAALDDLGDRSTEAIVKAGLLLRRLKEEVLQHGQWMTMLAGTRRYCGKSGLTKAERFMAIGRNEALTNSSNMRNLPDSVSTLHALSKLPAAYLQERIDNGDVHAAMPCERALELVDAWQQRERTTGEPPSCSDVHDVDLRVGNSADVLKTLPADCVDLTVTSPPYDGMRDYDGHRFEPEEFWQVAHQLYRVTKPGGVVVWIVGDQTENGEESGTSFNHALYFKNEAGFRLHQTIIWSQQRWGTNALGHSAVRYWPAHEYMFVLSKDKPKTFNPIRDKPNRAAGKLVTPTKIRRPDATYARSTATPRLVAKVGMRSSIWECPPDRSGHGHPAPFPVQLAFGHIVTWSNPGDTVLDPFLGSGSSAIAALKAGRRFIGIDIVRKYVEVARRRIAAVRSNPMEESIVVSGENGENTK